MNNLLDTKECRICLSDDLIENMICPCLCTGTNKYVHEECLKKFIMFSNNESFKKECYICKNEYNYEVEDIECIKCSLSLFSLNVLFSLIIVFLINSYIFSILNCILLLFILILPFFVNILLSIKKKYILLKLYCKELMLIPFLLLFIGIFLLQYEILNIYGYYLGNISIFMIWNIHYKCINKLNKFEHFKILSIDNV